MEYTQKLNEHLQKLAYLEGTREKNLQVLNDRVKEINEEKRKRETNINKEINFLSAGRTYL